MTNPTEHTHEWTRVHEQSLLGGSFPVGWECEGCRTYLLDSQVTPERLQGIQTTRHKLIGIGGGRIISLSGRDSRVQVYDEQTGVLEYKD